MRMCLTVLLIGLYLCLFHVVATAEVRIYGGRFVRVSAIIEIEPETKDLRSSPQSGDRDTQVDFANEPPRGLDVQAAHEHALVEGGDQDVRINLSNRYLRGNGVQGDYTPALRWRTEALKWYHRAAERGDVSAQTLLVSVYRYVDGVEKDYAERLGWLREATEQDSYDAQMSLGFMYDEGQGVSEDDEETLRWYRRAAGRPL